MAVAAYASLVSLSHVLDNVQQRFLFQCLYLNRKQITNLQENILSLIEFLEVHSLGESLRIKDLVRQISILTYQAEDFIDSLVVDQLHHASQHHSDKEILPILLNKVIQKLELVKKNLLAAKDEREEVEVKEQQGACAHQDLSTTFGDKNLVVGLDDHVDKIICELINGSSDLQIIPIIGMGGIGKTTLTRTIFEHSYIASHFDRRLWITVSQDYNIQKILSTLLNDKRNKENMDILGEKLYKELFNRRYLIVMDDVWSIEVWDDLKRWFPNNKNRSRILMTTRLSSLHKSLRNRNPYFMTLLDEHNSWSLLCQTVFGKQSCPYQELEQVGKKITKSCKGLPIAITVIGRLLAKSNMTLEYWESVAENVKSFGNLGDDEQCLNVLYLSYNHLPIHLKPCFLYMRVFPEDDSIRVPNLIKLWVAEGFIKQVGIRSLEEIAYVYLKDLIDRNMVFVCRVTSRGIIKSCGIHDLLRDLCCRESVREAFMYSPKVQQITSSEWVNEMIGFLCIRQGRYLHIRQPRLVQVITTKTFFIFKKTLQPTTLRHISVSTGLCNFGSLPTLHLLWNLQTLNISFPAYLESTKYFGLILLPSEIWEMPQLRNIEVSNAFLPDPKGKDFHLLSNMQSLSLIKNLNCIEEVSKRMPNLKKLDLISSNSLFSLVMLQNLESLCLDQEILSSKLIAFPNSLKKLKLRSCELPWDDIGIIGSLPNLEVLVLRFKAFVGPKWNSVDGEFHRLKVLAIEGADLEWWESDDTHFPNLVKLKLCYMHELQEIPSGIGDIATLQKIELYGCADSIVDSAKQIWAEQQSFGNDSFRIFIDEEEWIGNRDDDDDNDVDS